MPLRSFRADDGTCWKVWRTRAGYLGRDRDAPTEWLAFQKDDGTERRRLMQIPATWFELSDERLELLRRVAEPVSSVVHRHSPPDGTAQADDPDS